MMMRNRTIGIILHATARISVSAQKGRNATIFVRETVLIKIVRM